ncbi:MAG: VacB/RNase II family 3'-5' exoribonuclease [Planctomycetota bacterium]|nr:VacB/RNase II family 3'-5' exoribonuclease [Planctomycetota bacterium]
MPARFQNRILEHLSHKGYHPSLPKVIAKELRVAQDLRDIFKEALQQAVEGGLVEIGRDGCVRLPVLPDELIGKYRSNKRGFGFVSPSQKYREGDVYIPRGGEGDAITGDIVRVSISRSGKWKGKGSSGRIIEVIERAKHDFVGTLIKQGKQWLAKPDGSELHDFIIIRDAIATNAKAGDKVAFEIIHFPERDYYGEGVITKVLGDAGKPDVETQAVIMAFGLHDSFNDESLEEAREVSANFEQSPDDDREDLTNELVFTIDPPNARDFDDAINISYDEAEGTWELGVHIADVASFVKPESALDSGAIKRGNSVYLPQHVVPMLPELLSNGVCSLQEGVRRWSKSVFIQFNRKGKPIGHRLSNTVIRSTKRLTYLEAQALIEGDEKQARKESVTGGAYSSDLIDALQLANTLANTLLKRRRKDGMIELNLPEVVLEFDDDGHVKDAHPEDDAFTHRIIEMFMVEANEALARTFAGLDIPILRRTHPEPKFGDMEELRLFARSVGVSMPEEPSREDLQRLLVATSDSESARAVHFAVLRTLTQATYSPNEIGHFALASDHYAHFTSPIRRYPDLTLHRVLSAYLDHTDNGTNFKGGKHRRSLIEKLHSDSRVLEIQRLVDLGYYCSSTERNAEQAERSLRMFLVLQFLSEHHIGDEFEGIITGFSASGFFVSLDRFLIEGLGRFDLLKNKSNRIEKWERIDGTGSIVSARSGAILSIGDPVKAQIAAVDLPTRQLELRITAFPEPKERKQQLRGNSSHRDRQSKRKNDSKTSSKRNSRNRRNRRKRK